MKRYHLKALEPRYLDLNDYSKLLAVVLRSRRPGPIKRFFNWLLGIRSKNER